MSQQNLVSFSIPEADMAEITAAIGTLKSKLLPALRVLSPDEKGGLAKMGDKTVSFVQKSLEHCTANPELAPQFLDVTGFASDVRAVESLRGIYGPMSQITDALGDTMILAGSDAYAAALVFYNSVRTAQKSNVVKAGTIFDDLSTRFPGRQKARQAEK